MVGDDEFRKMLSVALAARFSEAGSEALVQMTLERARFCELLAPLLNESASKLYLLGMFSLLDVILGLPMTQIISALPVDAEIKAALLGRKSSLSVALKLANCHESGNWAQYAYLQASLKITNKIASNIYIESVQWANRMLILQ